MEPECFVCVFVNGRWLEARDWQRQIYTNWINLPLMAHGRISESVNHCDTIRIKYQDNLRQIGTYQNSVYVRGKKEGQWQSWYPIREIAREILYPKLLTRSETREEYFSLECRV